MNHGFRILIFIVVSLIADNKVYAFSQRAAAYGTAAATVVERLSIDCKTPLDFGSITSSGNGGTIVVSPENKRHVTGDVRVRGKFRREICDVRGARDKLYSIHTPQSVTFFTTGSANNPLAVKDLTTFSVNKNVSASVGDLSATGKDRIYVGGTLVVPAHAAQGGYRGLIPITVSY